MQQSIVKSRIAPKDLIWYNGSNMYFLSSRDVLYVKSNGNYTLFYFDGMEPILSTHSMKEVPDVLSSKNFSRIHHSYIANMHFIKKTNLGTAMEVELTNGVKLPLSVRRKQQFLSQFSKL